MERYYFLQSALPEITLKGPVELTFNQLTDLFEMNLSQSDFRKFERILEPIDLYNIKALWLGRPLDDRGRFKAKELEEYILIRDNLPGYILQYLDTYETLDERLRYFSSMYVSLYSQVFDGFLGKYYQFERQLRLVLLALRAKKFGRDLVQQLQFEDPQDFFVAQILAQKDGSDFSPAHEFDEVKFIFQEYGMDPRKLDEALLKYRFERIQDMEDFEEFTIDKLLAYAVRLQLLETWQNLDQEQANLIVDDLSKYG